MFRFVTVSFGFYHYGTVTVVILVIEAKPERSTGNIGGGGGEERRGEELSLKFAFKRFYKVMTDFSSAQHKLNCCLRSFPRRCQLDGYQIAPGKTFFSESKKEKRKRIDDFGVGNDVGHRLVSFAGFASRHVTTR